ncbi:YrhK family protein [Rothia sp. P13129]|uniref:YrhK family protein n=1 Tax=unclassified Rothia (in: high G+C Gram-positive bacteria) TaxID=2689056 RepID=UPI003ACF4F1A
MKKPQTDTSLEIRWGNEELIIRQRYETLSILNDILIGVIFLIGSFLFFSPKTVTAGTWLFVVGSMLMLIRPSIRITRHIHLRKLRTKYHSTSGQKIDQSFDF